jgi:hypothetical protein
LDTFEGEDGILVADGSYSSDNKFNFFFDEGETISLFTFDYSNNNFQGLEKMFSATESVEDAWTLLLSQQGGVVEVDTMTLLSYSSEIVLDTTGGVDLAVSEVPVPSAVWLFGSGFIALVSSRKRNKT